VDSPKQKRTRLLLAMACAKEGDSPSIDSPIQVLRVAYPLRFSFMQTVGHSSLVDS
jgi:hypothetical protein